MIIPKKSQAVIPRKKRPEFVVDKTDLIRRSYAAYYKKRQPSDEIDAPGPAEVEVCDGKCYVVLYNVRGILEVYRVRNDGALKCLKRYPKEIAEKYPHHGSGQKIMTTS